MLERDLKTNPAVSGAGRGSGGGEVAAPEGPGAPSAGSRRSTLLADLFALLGLVTFILVGPLAVSAIRREWDIGRIVAAFGLAFLLVSAAMRMSIGAVARASRP